MITRSEADPIYRCACSWLGGDPDVMRGGRTTCPACWLHDHKRVTVVMESRSPAEIADAIAMILFDDTLASRVLRLLARADGKWAQADFMREYHRRCARGNTAKSGFCCNFGRYLAGDGGWSHPSKGQRVAIIRQIPRLLLDLQRGQVRTYSRCDLEWAAPPIPELLAFLSPTALQRAYERIERQLTDPRPTDHEHETIWWYRAIQSEIAVRFRAQDASISRATEVSTPPPR